MTHLSSDKALREIISVALRKRYAVHARKPNAHILKKDWAVDAVFRKLPPITTETEWEVIVGACQLAIVEFEKEQGLRHDAEIE